MIARPLSALLCTAAQTSLGRKTSQQTKFMDLNQAPLEDSVAPIFLFGEGVGGWDILAQDTWLVISEIMCML